ncbi:S8 family serine peptidase [Saccharopolyspora sp. NPDC050642]|uniref:S8 family serine peptidase n=1 Tax=Saccharopolyspora sp. NPDC050642 TaxID=3157099 RepID=UPI0033DCD564
MRRVLAVAAAALFAVSAAPVAFAQGPTGQCTPPAETTIERASWAQERMAADRVWPLTKGSVTVAVVDTGVSAAAPTLSGAVERGTDLHGGLGNGDCFGRGTFIAGLIAARQGRGPFVGIAPGTSIYPVRVSDDPPKIQDHAALSREIAAGIRSSVDAGARVVAVGLVSTIGTEELKAAVEYATSRDVVVLAAAAVPKKGQLAFPARYPDVVAVAPVAVEGPLTELSYGAAPDVAAPANDLVGIAPAGAGNRVGSGIELAVGYAAGAVALVRSYHRTLSAAQVVDRLQKTADQPAGRLPNEYIGYGVVDPFAAVTTILDTDPPVQAVAERLSVPLPEPPDPEPGNRALWFAGLAGAVALLIAGPAIVATREKRRRES